DVGVHDGRRRSRPVRRLAGQLDGAAFGGVQPAVGGDLAVAGVQAEDDAVRKGLAHGGAPGRILEGACAQDNTHHAPAQGPFNVFLGANAAADLTVHAGGLHDSCDGGAVDRPALAGAVEVHEVQELGALRDPAPGHGGGVGVVDGLTGVVALA